MKNSILALAALAVALPAAAQEDFHLGEITLGVMQRDESTNSSKFLEYRDIPQGPVAQAVSFIGKKGDLRYRVWGQDITQKDQRYYAFLDNRTFKLEASYLGIPHNFGNGGKSILSPTTDSSWQLSDTLQQAYQNSIAAVPGSALTYAYLSNLVAPSLAAAPANVDLKLLRGRSTLAFTVTPKDSHLEVGVNYFHERRSGTRAANGTSFGFGNVVETPEPVRYITQDLAVNASYKAKWGVAQAAFGFNDFKDAFDTFSFDNPFRATDATDPSAYTAPGAGSKGGPKSGTTALPPDNKAVTEKLGASIKLGKRSRLSADASFGQWRQDHDPLLAWTTNTAITTPSGLPATTAPLPAQTLDGKIDTTALNLFFNTRLTDDLGLNARYRRYDANNKTPRYSLDEGYVRFDAVWEDIPRISVPYGYTNDMFDAYATFDRGPLGLEAGFKHNKMARTFRETDDTSENVFRVAADLHGDWWSVRGSGEFGSRDYDAYDAARSEDASFLDPDVPANQTVLRRPDQAKRDLARFGGQAEISPGSGRFTLSASYLYTRFKYNQDPVPCQDVADFPGQAAFCAGGSQAPLGLQHDKYDTFSAEANYTVTERANVYAFYTWEDGDILQDGRQSGATVNFAPNDVFDVAMTTRGNSFGAGADLTLVPEKWYFNLVGRYQKVDGNNLVSLLPGFSTAIYGTSPALQQCVGGGGGTPCEIPQFDDTKLATVIGSVKYRFAKLWSAGAGLGYEDYKIADAQTGNALNYMPASFFLQADNRNYSSWVGFVQLTRTWQ